MQKIKMIGCLFKTKFYSKCKSAIRLTKTRLEMIKRRRNAMHKFLKNDIRDLLRSGFDVVAYGRAEGFLVEQNLSACYDFVDLFCDCIVNHLSVMTEQRECPEECKEAVPSLMFAAARFADLPELRDLRSLFAERYGHSLEAHVNQEFVKTLKALPPTKDMKLQLLQDVAVESDLQWDSKTLEQKQYNAPPSGQAWSKKTEDDTYKFRDDSVQDADNSDSDNKQRISWDAGPRRYKQDFPYLQKKEVSNTVNDALPGEDDQFRLPHGKREKAPSRDVAWGNTDQIDLQNNLKSEGNVSEGKLAGENRTSKYRFIPPPYTKPKPGETKTTLSEDNCQSEDDLDGEANVKARSVRTRQSKLPPSQKSTIGSDQSDGEGMLNSSGTIAMNGVGDDQQDEEERVMDGLLTRYSSKEWTFKAGKSESALKQPAVDAENSRKQRSRSRASSLQLEPVTPVETTRGHVRSQSFEPEASHVHPKLPDYDDFIARLSALRGK